MGFSQRLLFSDSGKEFGGEHSVGKRKGRRPLDRKKGIHLVLRSSLAVKEKSFLSPRHAGFIKGLVAKLSRAYGIRVYEFSNVGNHLHLLIRVQHREDFKTFLRVLSGKIAQRITGAVKGKPFGKRFWDLPAYTRIVEWGKAFRTTRQYVYKNTLEALGLIVHLRKKQKPHRKS